MHQRRSDQLGVHQVKKGVEILGGVLDDPANVPVDNGAPSQSDKSRAVR